MAHDFVQSYTYDELNRLTNAEEIKNSVQQWEQTYTFDRYGNRNFDEANTTTLAKNCGSSPNFEVCSADVPVVNPSVNTANNKLTGTTYDAAGNVIADAEGRHFTYDAENKQVEVENGSSQLIGQYYFDGDGKRVKKVVPNGETTIFVYDASGRLIGEYSTEVQPSQDAKTQYLTADHLGTPRINTNSVGAVVSRSDYMPYGEEITDGRSSGQGYVVDDVRQGFTGYENDDETGLEYAQARMYAKSLGRFNSADPLYIEGKRLFSPVRLNLYGYAANNPILYRDPLGLDIEVTFKSEKERDAYLKAVNKTLNGRYKVEIVNGKLQVVGGAKAIEKIDRTKLNNGQAGLLGAITDSSKTGRVDLGNGFPNDSVHVERHVSPGLNQIDTSDFDKVRGGGITPGEIAIHATTEAFMTADGATTFQQAHDNVSQLGVGGLYAQGVTGIPNTADGGATLTGYVLDNTWYSGRTRNLMNQPEPGSVQHKFEFDTPIPKADLDKHINNAKFVELWYDPKAGRKKND